MSSTINMNVVVSQGNAVKEVQSVKHQNLELNQPLVAQQRKKKEEEGKNRVQEFEDTEKAKINKDESRDSKQEPKSERNQKKKEKGEETTDNKQPDHIVDIVV